MMSQGKTIILVGIGIVTIGVFVYFFGDKLSWFGKLPGDIRIENEHTKFYFPITSMLLLSIAINLVWWIIKRLS